jgi:sugar transferase (PEP-CTERM system associated)
MIRLFHVYYPVRTLVLFVCEAIVICCSFLLAAVIHFGPDSYLVLNYEAGMYKILGLTAVALLGAYYFDLYNTEQLTSEVEVYFRLLVVLGVLSILLAGVSYYVPGLSLGQGVGLIGIIILTIALLTWRFVYSWLLRQPAFQEPVYVLGAGERAERLVMGIKKRTDLGMAVVAFAGEETREPTREQLSAHLSAALAQQKINRIIVAIADRRGVMPVNDLLQLRMAGVRIEEATALLEKISGKIEVDQLYPSSLIYAEGFQLGTAAKIVKRVSSIVIALSALIVLLPILPLIALAIKLTSPGPVIYSQARVGYRGKAFYCHKFRTMRADAEAKTGAVWAGADDPRITSLGRLLRKIRLDEVPQLWNVLKGEMSFVGPRPERPEFVSLLSESIPYYQLRHIIRPGLTGWAQVRYRYGASIEDAKEKLRYDLYYIKHMSLGLDLLIAFETIKIVLLRRGSQ